MVLQQRKWISLQIDPRMYGLFSDVITWDILLRAVILFVRVCPSIQIRLSISDWSDGEVRWWDRDELNSLIGAWRRTKVRLLYYVYYPSISSSYKAEHNFLYIFIPSSLHPDTSTKKTPLSQRNTPPSPPPKSAPDKKEQKKKQIPTRRQHTIAQNIVAVCTHSKPDTPIPMVAQRHFHCSKVSRRRGIRYDERNITRMLAVKWGIIR